MVLNMKIPPGSYIELSYEISYMEAGEKKYISTTKRVLRKKKFDEKTGREKEVEEVIDNPTIIKLGAGEIPKYFEQYLLEADLETGRRYQITFSPEKAYGKRDPKKIESIPTKRFRERIDKKIFMLEGERRRPRVGDIVYIRIGDAAIYYGKVIRVSERAVIVDTNHPLSGRKIDVLFTIHSIIPPTETREKRIEVVLKKFFGDKSRYISYSFEGDTLQLSIKEDYFERFPEINRETARIILEEIYIPKLLLTAYGSELYNDFGITKIHWFEEKEIIKVEKQAEETAILEKEQESKEIETSKQES